MAKQEQDNPELQQFIVVCNAGSIGIGDQIRVCPEKGRLIKADLREEVRDSLQACNECTAIPRVDPYGR